MPLPEHPTLPDVITQALHRLQRAGHTTWLAGEGLANAWWTNTSSPSPRPAAWLALCGATMEELLALEPHAVPTGLRAPVATIPTPAGPLDVRCGWGADAAQQDPIAALADFGFSVHAIAYDPVAQQWVDPFDARADIEARRLSCVGNASEVVAREPIAPLRALRFISEADLTADAELEAALRNTELEFSLATRRQGRSELARILLGAHAGKALAFAERTGLADKLAPTRNNASVWIDSLPRDLDLRLAAWLQHEAGRWLRHWRFGVDRSNRILDWLAHHPIEGAVDPRRAAAVGKLERRFGAEGLRALFALREAELASGVLDTEEVTRARKALGALEQAIERVRANRERSATRKALALDGASVMALLGCGPGRKVGLALHHLTAWVAEDPLRNQTEKLQVELQEWARKQLD